MINDPMDIDLDKLVAFLNLCYSDDIDREKFITQISHHLGFSYEMTNDMIETMYQTLMESETKH